MKELFVYFNDRYDGMNESLMKSLKTVGALTTDDVNNFVDYFNLCAEEHVFHELGCIYEPVYLAWRNGMKWFGKDPRVVNLWMQERESNSYYGFEFPVQTRDGLAHRDIG